MEPELRPQPSRRAALRAFWPSAAMALLSRLVYSFYIQPPLQGDSANYAAIAHNVAEHFFFGTTSVPDSSRPPLYSLLLALVNRVLRLPMEYWTWVGLNCVLDLTSLWLLVVVGLRTVGRASLLGVFVLATSPLWFAHVNSPITEPLSVTLFLAFFERWTRPKRSVGDECLAALYCGLLTLTRSMFLWFPLGLVIFERLMDWLRPAPRGALIPLKRAAPFVLLSLIPPVIWGVRNLVSTGTFVMSQDSFTGIMMAWFTLHLPLLDWRLNEHAQWVFNHPYAGALLGRASPQRMEEVKQLMKKELIEYLTHHPLAYLEMLGPKTLRLWLSGWWNPYNYVYSPPYLSTDYIFVFAVPGLGFGIWGWLRYVRAKVAGAAAVVQWRATRAQLCVLLYITAVTLPFTVDARYSLIGYVTLGLWFGLGVARVME